VVIPGSNDVNMQFQKGKPLKVMQAFAADYNEFVEPLRDADSASYTPTNSVSTSNHLNGTAMDLNWDSHPFHVRGTFTAAQMRTIRELLAYYEGMIYWGGDWTDPIDEMHWQMGYQSYNNPKLDSFITRKIRSDGFSTFRRGVIQGERGQERPVPAPVGSAGGFESRSPYRTPGEGVIGGLDVFELNGDAMIHQMFVEWCAVQYGDVDAIQRIVRAAAGEGADRSPQFIRHARRVLAKVPAADLDAVLDTVDPAWLAKLAQEIQ
jgi:hypothetical protein